MKSLRSFWTAVGAAVALSACSPLAVGPASPRPNVMTASGKGPSELVLGPGVSDEFIIPGGGGIDEVPVRAWRGTLTTGFANAFRASTARGIRKLELVEAQLSFSPLAVDARHHVASVVATIRYKSRLVDGAGNETLLAGTVHAREPDPSPTEAGMTDNASKAVEALFEELNEKLLAK